ncbi:MULTISPECIES: UvrB/UvrC motif-containing protein, partial [Rhodopirellula]
RALNTGRSGTRNQCHEISEPSCETLMKCQYCDKPATFHITELTEPDGPQVLHLCEQHARNVLQKGEPTPVSSVAGALAKQLQLGQTKEELRKLDQKECPVCGITFFEFRNSGRLGCPLDYDHFEADLKPLLINIHDSLEHTGKRPTRAAATADSQADLIRLRKEMEAAVEREEYERASELRDQINAIQGEPKRRGNAI